MANSHCLSIESTTGSIGFDVDNDQQVEMTLNATGLGIFTNPSANLNVAGNAFFSEQLFIGGDSGSSNLNIHGNYAFKSVTVSSNITLSNSTLVLADSSSGNLVITLPNPSAHNGILYKIKKIHSSNDVFIIASSGNTIDGAHGFVLKANGLGALSVISDGDRKWYTQSSLSCNALWQPSELSLAAWYDGFDISHMTLESGNVRQWNDKSGNDHHALQTTTSKQPTYLNSGGLSFLGGNKNYFLGTSLEDKLLDFNGGASTHDGFAVYCAMKDENSNPQAVAPSGNWNDLLANSTTVDSGFFFRYNHGNLDPVIQISNSRFTPPNFSADEQIIMGFNYDKASGNGRAQIFTNSVNGSSSSTEVAADFSANDGLYLGGRDSPWRYFESTLYELIAISEFLSDAEVEKLEGYLAWKWGMVSNLTASHGYKNFPPQ